MAFALRFGTIVVPIKVNTLDDILYYLAARNSIFEPSNFFFLFLMIASKGDEKTTLSLAYYYASGLCVPRERLRFSFTIINTIYRLLIMIIDIINYA